MYSAIKVYISTVQCALKICSVLRNGGTGKLSTAVHMVAVIQYFFDQTPWLLYFSLQVLLGLLFEDGYYSRVVFISLASLQASMTTG